jgi:hypothetical protein
MYNKQGIQAGLLQFMETFLAALNTTLTSATETLRWDYSLRKCVPSQKRYAPALVLSRTCLVSLKLMSYTGILEACTV